MSTAIPLSHKALESIPFQPSQGSHQDKFVVDRPSPSLQQIPRDGGEVHRNLARRHKHPPSCMNSIVQTEIKNHTLSSRGPVPTRLHGMEFLFCHAV